jgi:hypothetical protein
MAGCADAKYEIVVLICAGLRAASAADLKSLTHSLQNRLQGLQIESGTGIMDLPVPITSRSPLKKHCGNGARTSESGH